MNRTYTGAHRKGIIPKSLAPADAPNDDAFRLGDVLAEVEMEAPPPYEENSVDD
jgi:hypothetical protein